MRFRTLDEAKFRGKRVLLRADLNVPVKDGRITDLTRLERLSPTIRELALKGARVIVVSHFGRPKGERLPEFSLRPVAAALAEVLSRPVAFAPDCIGPQAAAAVAALGEGEIIVLENLRYHAGEEKNERKFAQSLAALADLYVNDAFSAAHRAHASTEAIAQLLPAFAGRGMQAELQALEAALGTPKRPVMAVVGGAKVSTKLELLGNLIGKVNVLVIGGAMANTFLAAQGMSVGSSLEEPELHETARRILAEAKTRNCLTLLPEDAVVAAEFRPNPETETVPIESVPPGRLILDIGPASVAAAVEELVSMRTLIWNGPLGAFETPPFDAATVALAKAVADATATGTLTSIAGGGDTISALRYAGVAEKFSYVSTAGGAFLEWLEGKTLPGVAALES